MGVGLDKIYKRAVITIQLAGCESSWAASSWIGSDENGKLDPYPKMHQKMRNDYKWPLKPCVIRKL